MREFAFWLRDLRTRSGLTYAELGRAAHYATSTMQDAAGGQRLPTLRVLQAFVAACGGDLVQWETYWTQVKRLVDRHTPTDLGRSVEPPWIEHAYRVASGDGKAYPDRASKDDGWYVKSLTALLRLDTDPIEAVEQRVIVATVDDLAELTTAISVPRRSDDDGPTHQLEVELLYGGLLERREQPFESFFTNVITLPRPLCCGEPHEYALRMRIPFGQPMAPHYVHVPLERSDCFNLRVRFRRDRLPKTVFKLDGVSTAVIYESNPASEIEPPDRFGEVRVSFQNLRQGLTYGVSWIE